MTDGLELFLADATSNDSRKLIEELDAYQLSLYPAELCHRMPPEEIQEKGVFYLARLSGDIVGCGGLVPFDDNKTELKRMFVRPAARGQGIARQMFKLLEVQARHLKAKSIYLETGPPQREAVAFYLSVGFETCGPFGGYEDHPLSIFMEKRLDFEPSQSNGSAA